MDFDALRSGLERDRAFEAAIDSRAQRNGTADADLLGAWKISTFSILDETSKQSLFEVKRIESSRLETDSVIYNTIKRPQDAHTCVLYMHGGAWIWNSHRTYERLGRLIAEMSGFPVYVPNYRKAPEYPHPFPFLDALATVKYLSQNGYRRIILIGDSAGGQQSVSLMHALYGSNTERSAPENSWMQQVDIVCSVLIYPALFNVPSDPAHFDAYKGEHGYYSPFINFEIGYDAWDVFECKNSTCRDVSPYSSVEYFSPLSVPYTKERYENIPRSMIVVSDTDVLLDDGTVYYERLREASREEDEETEGSVASSQLKNDETNGEANKSSERDASTAQDTKQDVRPPGPKPAPIPKHSLFKIGHSFHGFMTSDVFPFSRKRDLVKRMVQWIEICLDDVHEEPVRVNHFL